MNQVDQFRQIHDMFPVENRDEIISRYQRLRQVGRSLNDQLVNLISKDAVHEGGRSLGILRGETLAFHTEAEAFVLMEYCIYNVRRNGRNAIEQFLIDSPPDPESDEMACLRAMQHAIYSVFVVESVDRGLGVIVRNLKSQEVFLVVDLGFGQTAKPGLVFASRLLHQDGFSMTSGATLPIAVVPKDQLGPLPKEMSAAMTPDDNGPFDPAPLIRACLSRGCSSNIQYQDPNPSPRATRQRIPNGNRSVPMGRNSPCPCGSGRKFKQCCLKQS